MKQQIEEKLARFACEAKIKIDFDKELVYYGILGNILPRTG
jgi:hypothetical protein